jgi:MFS family permease
VARWVNRGRGKALGFVYMGSNLGGFLFAPVAAGLAASLGWRTALVWMAVGGALVLIPFGAFLIREPTAAEEPTRADEQGVSAVPSPAGNPSSAVNPSSAENDLDVRAALRTRSFWILAFALFAMFFFYIAVNTHFVLFLENVGVDNQTATGWYGIAIGMGLAIKLVSGFIADLVSPKSGILLDQGLFTVTALVAMLVPATGFLPLFVMTYGICTAARDVVLPLAVADCFGPKYLAEIYGVLMLTLLPGGFFGPIFAGAVADRFGSYDWAFVAFAVLNLAGFLLLFGLRRETREFA